MRQGADMITRNANTLRMAISRQEGADMSTIRIDRRTRPKKPTRERPMQRAVLVALLLAAVVVFSGLVAFGADAYATTVTFTGEELLGKPTNDSVTINIVPAADIVYRYEYGTTSGAPYRFRRESSRPPPVASRTK